MKITVIRSDAVVGVDGVFRNIDVSNLDPTIHAIHFDTTQSKGNVEFKAYTDKGNLWLTDFAPYQIYLDRWTAAAPPPFVPPVPQSPEPDAGAVLRALIKKGLITDAEARAEIK